MPPHVALSFVVLSKYDHATTSPRHLCSRWRHTNSVCPGLALSTLLKKVPSGMPRDAYAVDAIFLLFSFWSTDGCEADRLTRYVFLYGPNSKSI